MAHTKGPWEVVNMNHLGPHAIRMHYADEKKFYGVRQIHREADARLIAAAPDMLEALQDIIPEQINTANYNVTDEMIVPLDFTMCELRKIAAAIAKATQQ